MSLEENTAQMRRFYEEVFNKGNVTLIDELCAPSFYDHDSTNSTHDGEGVRQFTIALRTAFPDVQCMVNDIVAEGDKVAARFTLWGTHRGEFMGIPATGRHIEVSGIDIVRFEAGKAAEHWGEFDQLGMGQQLGGIPPLA